MLTRVEIDGFKTFENFTLDLRPFTAIVGPNASGKSNFFDALRFLSLLAQGDIRSAMNGVRGEPEELFRRTPHRNFDTMKFAVEVLIDRTHKDDFGEIFATPARRLRYEVHLGLGYNNGDGAPRRVTVLHERCTAISSLEETAEYLKPVKRIHYTRKNPVYIELSLDRLALELRQDGPGKHGKPSKFALKEAQRTALSTVSSAEFPHVYALKELLKNTRFLEINPRAARSVNDRFEERVLRPDASNLALTLARLKEQTATNERPNGILSDIAADLCSMIPSVRDLEVRSDADKRQYSFALKFAEDMEFSSRVISDGTLRLLALLTLLDDPERQGTLCFEEPENGVHEGRVANLVKFLREAAHIARDDKFPSFQVLVNTHSSDFLRVLDRSEIVAADTVATIDPIAKTRTVHTRMRSWVEEQANFLPHPDRISTFEVDRLLKSQNDAA